MAKITKTTIKSFIKKNFDNLYIKKTSHFDGMTDGVENIENPTFLKVEKDERIPENTLGVAGAWFVGQSRDYFYDYEDDNFKGYEISNCCGGFILAIKK